MYERTPISSGLPFVLQDVKDYTRVDHDDEDPTLSLMASTAALEIEVQADLALVAQVITLEMDAWGCAVILPVGPFYPAGQADNPVTVTVIDADGTETPLITGWRIDGVLRPVIRFATRPKGAQLRISYPAGFGDGASALPLDLHAAICAQVAFVYDQRGDDQQGLSPQAARIVARYKRVRL